MSTTVDDLGHSTDEPRIADAEAVDTSRTIYEVIGEAVGDEWDERTADEITDKIMADLECPEPWRSLFAPLVRSRVSDRQAYAQNRSRHAKRQATVSEVRNSAQASLGTEVDGQAISLVGLEGQAEQWALLDTGERVKWGAMTMAQHRQRRSWFDTRVKTMARQVALHGAVIERCEAAGVDTLFELIKHLRKGQAA